MEELQDLRRYHDALPGASPESVDEARSRLADHVRGRRRVRPVWRPVLAAATATLLAVVVTVGPGVTRDPRVETPHARPSATELRLRPVANAQDLADNAAALASGEPEWRQAEWAYTKSLNARTRVDGGEWLRGEPSVTTTREQWRRLDETAFAAVEKGKLKMFKGSEFEVTYHYLLALPLEPDQLLARIYDTVDADNADRRAEDEAQGMRRAPVTFAERDRQAFEQIAMGMRDTALPARLRAAMYGAMAGIPGVRYEATSSDLLERPGVTLYHVLDGYLRDEIFIDPETYEYLGYRTIVVKNHDDPPFGTMRKGEIHHWDALAEAAFVGKAGQRPG